MSTVSGSRGQIVRARGTYSWPVPGGAGRRRHVPAGSVALGLVLLASFLYQAVLPPTPRELFILRWSAVPMEISERNDLQPTVPFPVAGTLLTSLFLHGDVAHLLTNLFYLWVFGPAVERVLGSARFLLVYLLGGLGGALLHVVINPTSLIPLVGASGAIAGLMAASLVLSPGLTVQAIVFGGWAVAQFVDGAGALTPRAQRTGGLAIWAHAGGLIVGGALAPFWRRCARRSLPPDTTVSAVSAPDTVAGGRA